MLLSMSSQPLLPTNLNLLNLLCPVNSPFLIHNSGSQDSLFLLSLLSQRVQKNNDNQARNRNKLSCSLLCVRKQALEFIELGKIYYSYLKNYFLLYLVLMLTGFYLRDKEIYE